MDLSVYYKPLLRLWWLLAAATLVAGFSTYLTVRTQPATYQAKTTLMIGRIIDDPNPSSGEFILAEQLASAYADAANRKPVYDATKAALGLDFLPQYLARSIPQSQIIEITVTDVNPLRAQVVANELGNQLILRSPSGELSVDQARRDFINQQIDDLQSQIVNTQNEIAKLQEELGSLNSASDIQETQNQITAQQQKLSTLQGTYANLLLNTQQGATNTLFVVEPAEVPTVPIGPNKNLTVLIAAGIGFILAAGAAYLLDYLDDTLKTPEEVKRILGLPVIGFIAETRDNEDGKYGVYVSKNPRSPVAEAYRSLRANLQFMGEEQALKSILITSTNIGVGKTSVSTNLAAVLAQGDNRVVLIDADLHKPKIHEVVNVANKFGLTDIYLNGLNVEKALINFKDEKFKVISSGRPIENPADLLVSEKMDQILAKLRENADYIIIDSPPLVVADALFLAAKVDGILLVVRPGHIRKKVALGMLEQFNRSGVRVLGVVFNRIPLTGFDAYGGVNYYSNYYSSDQDTKQTTPSNLNEYLRSYYGKAQAGIRNLRSRKAG